MNHKESIITSTLIREMFVLVDNVLYWKERPKNHFRSDGVCSWWNSMYAGKPAGSVGNKGYLLIRISMPEFEFRIVAHRLIWLWHYGSFPTGIVDHIDQNKLNNCITNLRDVDKVTNARNMKMHSNNTSGVSGVSWHKRDKKWNARCDVLGKRQFLGYFDDLQDALNAVTAFRIANGFTAQHGAKQ